MIFAVLALAAAYLGTVEICSLYECKRRLVQPWLGYIITSQLLNWEFYMPCVTPPFATNLGFDTLRYWPDETLRAYPNRLRAVVFLASGNESRVPHF